MPREVNAERIAQAAKGLGRTQVLVLQLLANGAKTCRTLGYDWPSLTEESARSTVDRLGGRGLVDAVRFEPGSGAREFGLTELGEGVERAVSQLDPLDEEDDGYG